MLSAPPCRAAHEMRIPDPVACSPAQVATPPAAPERPPAQAGPSLHQTLSERSSSGRTPARHAGTSPSGAPAGKAALVRNSATLPIPAAWTGNTGDDPGTQVAAVAGAARTGAGPPDHAASSVAVAAPRLAPSQATGAADPPAPPAKPPPEPTAPTRPRRRDSATTLLWALLLWTVVVLAVLLAQAFSSPASRAERDGAAEVIVVQPPHENPPEAPGPR